MRKHIKSILLKLGEIRETELLKIAIFLYVSNEITEREFKRKIYRTRRRAIISLTKIGLDFSSPILYLFIK